MNVGLIGSGMIGKGIGLNLIRNGFKLHVYQNISEKNTRELEDLGAEIHKTLSTIASDCSVIILCLPNSSIVEGIIMGGGGLYSNLSQHSVIVDCSTSDPSSTRKLYEHLKEKNIYLLDAPVTRGPKEAMEGRLNTLVGGEKEVFVRYKDLLSTFSENVIFIGDSGRAHEIKLANNFISMGFTAIVILTITEMVKKGQDLEKLDQVMRLGSNYVSSLPLMIDWINNNENEVLQFSIKNAYKDMNYFQKWIKEDANDTSEIVESIVNTFYEASQYFPNEENLPMLFNFFTKENL